jgi:hypothetical protein
MGVTVVRERGEQRSMPWWDILKRKSSEQPESPAQPGPLPRRELPMAGSQVIGNPPIGRRSNPNDPALRERRRARIERRIRDLRYDIGQAELAQAEHNRWTERIEGINQAIEQARSDIEVVLTAPPGWVPQPLPAWPVVIESVQPDEPAEIRLRVGEVPFLYSEALDWAERGHQKAPPELRRTEGEIEQLMPDSIPADRRAELRDHLAHGLATLVTQIREDALDGKPSPSLTLADLASPCDTCGGWRDLKGRCPACQEREWQADQLQSDIDRLIKERNDLTEELAKFRERLPLLHRQLADSEAELATLSGE